MKLYRYMTTSSLQESNASAKASLNSKHCNRKPGRPRHYLAALLATITLPLVLSACTYNPENTAGLQASLNSDGEASVQSYKLSRDIQIQQLQGDSVNGLYRAKVVIENLKKKQQNLQYQFAWYDASNAEVADRSGWTPLVIYGKDQKTLMGIAPNAETSGFRIVIRDLKADKTFKTNFFGKR